MKADSFNSYLDDFDEITLIISKDKYHPNIKYNLVGNDEIIDLKIDEVINLGEDIKLITIFDAYLKLEMPYFVVSSTKEKSELKMGKITRSSLFDSIYYYKKDDLGVTYKKESSKFKIWSPTAKRVTLELFDLNNNVSYHELTYKNMGIWKTEIYSDLDSYKYRYIVYNNGKTKITVDPYAISMSANGEYGYIVDKSKFYKMKYNVKPYDTKNLDYIINEVSIRDFTSFFNDKNKGTYKFFTKSSLKNNYGETSGFDYLLDLGVTHVEIMPMFLFGGVNELNHDEFYNWGYNPIGYNTPSGYYSCDASDPYLRINELKKMIDILHKNNLKVIMDVVYNHVYDADNFPYEILCPGYMNIYNKEGMRTNYSGCENDVNSSKRMIRKYIIDSVKYWLNEYRIDGFRFDLMGLIDFETMNDIYKELFDINPSILIYGEGWKMVNNNQAELLSHMYNRNVISDIGFFNDKFRENIKNYCLGDNVDMITIKEVIIGSISPKFLFKYPHQSINYCECHDDNTVYDLYKIRKPEMKEEEIKKRACLALSMVLLSIGIPFMHSGMEFFRTKKLVKNSYKSKDDINMVNWDLIHENKDYIDFIKSLVNIRKKYTIFAIDNPTDIKSRVTIDYNINNTIFYRLNGEKDILVIFKNNDLIENVNFNEYRVLSSSLEYDRENSTISSIGTIVLIKE